MLKFISFGILFYDLGSFLMTLKLDGETVCIDDFGNLSCCFHYQLHNDICVACSIGHKMEDDLCVPCKLNTHGYQCLRKCNCYFDQRCDNVLGCVNASTITQPASNGSTTLSTENVTETRNTLLKTVAESEIPNPTPTNNNNHENITQTRSTPLKKVGGSKITNPTPTKNNNYGLLDREIVIYSVVVACILVILGLSYLVFKNRQKTKIKLNISNTTQNTHSNRSHSLINSNLSIYDEIDDNMIVENLDMNMVHINDRIIDDEIQTNTDNTTYLHPVHSADDSSSSPASVNNSYISVQESDQCTHSDESQRDEDTKSYLHPYYTIDEDWKEKTHHYDEALVQSKDSDDSSDSSTQLITDGYLNPYQPPLKDGWKQLSHSYEAPVTVYQCQQSLTIPFPPGMESKGMETIDKDKSQTMKDEHNIYPSRSFKKDNTEMSENYHQTMSIENSSDERKLKHDDYIVGIMTSSKHEIADAFDYADAISISPNTKMKDISKNTNNDLEI